MPIIGRGDIIYLLDLFFIILVFNFFISIRDSTVILTEVAVITTPKNKFKELSNV